MDYDGLEFECKKRYWIVEKKKETREWIDEECNYNVMPTFIECWAIYALVYGIPYTVYHTPWIHTVQLNWNALINTFSMEFLAITKTHITRPLATSFVRLAIVYVVCVSM